jgi:hypothetical protein
MYTQTARTSHHSERAQIDCTLAHPDFRFALEAAKKAVAEARERWAADPKAAWNEFYTGDPMPPSKVWPTGEIIDHASSLHAYCCALRAAQAVYGPREASIDSKAAWTAQFAKNAG